MATVAIRALFATAFACLVTAILILLLSAISLTEHVGLGVFEVLWLFLYVVGWSWLREQGR